MKKIIQGFLIGTCLLGLSACGNEISKNKPPKTESAIKNSTELTGENIESKETAKDTNADDSLWNNDKSLELKTFMNQWETVMDQKYQEYEQGENVTYYDMQLPKDIFEKNRFDFFEVDKEEVLLEWYTSGKEVQNTYQLLTVYSDADTQPDMEKHVYFFTLYNSEPRVLSGTLLQGNYEAQPVYFSETQNEALKIGFTKIITQGTAEQIVSNSSESSTTINNFDNAYNHVLNNKINWTYGEANVDTIEVYGVNEKLQALRQDEFGNFYDIVIETNDHQGSVMVGGKHFRVYTDGSIRQRFYNSHHDEWIKIL